MSYSGASYTERACPEGELWSTEYNKCQGTGERGYDDETLDELIKILSDDKPSQVSPPKTSYPVASSSYPNRYVGTATTNNSGSSKMVIIGLGVVLAIGVGYLVAKKR